MKEDIENKINYKFTALPNKIFGKVLISDFGKRERKVLDLIIRLSFGCGNRNYCFLRKVGFEVVGIDSAKIKVVLNSLTDKNIIIIEKYPNVLKIIINKDINSWLVKENGDEEKLAKLVGENLPNGKYKSYLNGNNKLAKKESQNVINSFTELKKQCSKEKDKEKLKKNNKEKVIINNNSEKGFDEMKKDLIEKMGFDI